MSPLEQATALQKSPDDEISATRPALAGVGILVMGPLESAEKERAS